MARRSRDPIPQTAAELTAAWLDTVLTAHRGGAHVTAVEVSTLGIGVGFVGEIHRCRLTWDGDGPRCPDSVIVKIPSAHKKNRALAEGLMAYEREIRVYRDIGPALGAPMPELYHASMDPAPAPWLERFILWLFDVLPVAAIGWLVDRFLALTERSTRRYILVLEDIADARPPVQAQGGSVDDTLAALAVLARLHATNWMNSGLVEANPIVWALDRGPKVIQAGYLRNREAFQLRFGAEVPAGLFTRLDQTQDRIPDLVRHMAGAPWTILHGDYRLDNLLFRPSGDIVVLDYQGVAKGRAGWDVAYFITTALEPEHRGQEPRLLHAYHDALVGAGVTTYSFDELDRDVAVTKELLVHRMVSGSSMIDTDTEEVEGDDTLVDLLFARTAGWLDLDRPDEAA